MMVGRVLELAIQESWKANMAFLDYFGEALYRNDKTIRDGSSFYDSTHRVILDLLINENKDIFSDKPHLKQESDYAYFPYFEEEKYNDPSAFIFGYSLNIWVKMATVNV